MESLNHGIMESWNHRIIESWIYRMTIKYWHDIQIFLYYITLYAFEQLCCNTKIEVYKGYRLK
jgi:hypothetical protein